MEPVQSPRDRNDVWHELEEDAKVTVDLFYLADPDHVEDYYANCPRDILEQYHDMETSLDILDYNERLGFLQ